MPHFTSIPHQEPIAQIIQAAFDTTLPLEGGWGYTQEQATIITGNPNNLPIAQIEHMVASMRAYLEMHITLPEKERYGSINLNELQRKSLSYNGKKYDKVTYKITAIKECDYTKLIEEYKKEYGKTSFDMEEHFHKRNEKTLIRNEVHWFTLQI